MWERRLGAEPTEDSVTVKLNKSIARRFGIVPDCLDTQAERRATLRSLRLNKGQTGRFQASRSDQARLEQHDRKLNDLEVIESQYTDYFQNISSKSNYRIVENSNGEFEKHIDKSRMSRTTKGILKLKAKTPFRINLDDFENLPMNLGKFYDMIGIKTVRNGSLNASSGKSKETLPPECGPTALPIKENLKFGKLATQPSFSEFPDYLQTHSEALLKSKKRKSVLDLGSLRESLQPWKPLDKTRQKLFQITGVKDELDKVSTRHSERTSGIQNKIELSATMRTTPRRNFMIKSNFKTVSKSPKKDISHLKDRFDKLSLLCTETSSRTSTFRLHADTQAASLMKVKESPIPRARQAIGRNFAGIKAFQNPGPIPSVTKETETNNLEHSRSGSHLSHLNNSGGRSSPYRKANKNADGGDRFENDEYLNNIVKYIDDAVVKAAVKPSTLARQSVRKQFKKLDIRDKIQQEVQRMFEADFKGQGSKSARLLANMMHHYISFGNPATSKAEVSRKVHEFMNKHNLKIPLYELKNLAAEKHFYITTVD